MAQNDPVWVNGKRGRYVDYGNGNVQFQQGLSDLMAQGETLSPEAKLQVEAIGAEPSGYQGVFQRAYGQIGQPGEVGNQWVQKGTSELAQSFIDRYHQKTGKLPDAGMVKDFVASNLTPDYAKQYIKGEIPRESIQANLVDPYIDSKDLIKPTGTQGNLTNLQPTIDQLNQFYNPLQEAAVSDIKRQFDPLRARAVEEEAALGRLRSGASAAQGSPIQDVTANEGNALQSAISNILGAKASGVLDLNKFNQNLALQQQSAKDARNQFQQTLGFNKQQYSDQTDYQNKALALQEMIGRMQAEGRKPGTLDYLGTAFGGAGALGGLAGGIGSLTTAFKK